jgi:hypothetical protein
LIRLSLRLPEKGFRAACRTNASRVAGKSLQLNMIECFIPESFAGDSRHPESFFEKSMKK